MRTRVAVAGLAVALAGVVYTSVSPHQERRSCDQATVGGPYQCSTQPVQPQYLDQDGD